MADTTKAELVEEVNQLRRRISILEQQRIDSAHVNFSITNEDTKENSCDPNWLNQIYRDAPVGLCYYDTQLRYININEWLAALNGLKVEEHIGHTLSELFPELAAKIEDQLLYVIETGEPILEGSICTETPADPNAQKYFQFSFVAVKSDAGEVVGINCVVIETTEQMRAEAMLQKSQNEMEHRISERTHELEVANAQLVSEVKERKAAEQSLKSDQRKLQISLNATGTSCWEINLKTGELTAQRPTTTWMGYEPNEVPQSREGWKGLIHPDDVDIPKNKFMDHLEGRAPLYECEYRVRGKSGEWYWTLDRGIIVQRETDGSPLLVVGTDTDISEQKQATEALHKNQQFLKNITDSDTQLVWVYDLNEQRHIYANPSLANFLGRPIQEISTCPGSYIRQQVHPDDLEIYDSHGRRVRKATDVEVLSRELRLKNHTGEYRWLSARDVVLERDATGSPLQILGTAVDITEQKRAECLLTGEKKILEVISSSSSQDGGLTELVEFIETQSDGMICSILLLDEEGLHLRHGASISLPDEYNRAIDGIEIGTGEGSCGTAAYSNQSVIVSDIASDPLWTNYRDFAMKHGLRACWSLPIQSSTGSVLGTFAMYYNKPRSPDAFHEMLTERAVHLASIAIERKKAEDKLTQSEQKLRRAQQIAHVGSYEVKPDGSPMNWSDECYRIFGLEPKSQLPSREQMLNQIVHPDDRGYANRTFQKSLNERSSFSYEYRVLRPDGSIRWVHSRGEPILDERVQIDLIQGTLMDITDRKLALGRLDEFNVALSNAMPGISRLNIDGRYVEVNDDYAKALGYEPHELIGGPWNPTVHPDDMTDAIQAYEDMCRDGKSEFEARAVRKDGSLFHKQVLMVRIADAAGTMTGHHCFMRDISERKSAEAALLESNDRFRTIFESVPECVKLLDADGKLLDMNAAGLAMIEADSIEDVRGESAYKLIAPEYLDEFITNGKKVFEGESNTQEFEFIGLRGTRRWMETHQVPLRNSVGKTTTLLAVTHDITERKRVEEAQRASEHWFRSIFEQAGVAVGVVESEPGKLVRVNSKYAKLLGYSSEELVGLTWMELTHPEDISQDQVKMDELIEGRIQDFSIEKRLIHKTGSVIWINLTVSSMWQPDEEPGQHIVIIEDITARKQAEAEIKSHIRQEAVVAELGQRALAGADPSELIEESVSVISTELSAEYAKIMELLPDGKSLRFRAMVGWNESALQSRIISIQSRSQAAATLRSNEPIIVEDLAADGRFDVTLSLSDHVIVSGITVVISGKVRPFGILGIHTCEKRAFTKHDISFLQAIANILGEAIDRKLAEEALKESEHRLRLVTDSIPAFISYMGADRCYEFVNKRYESTFGLERAQIVGKPVWDILGEEYYELIKPRLDSVLAGNPVKYESVVQIEQIGKRTLSNEHVPDRGPDGTVRGFYTLAVDITDRKKTEDELNTIFEMSLDLICVADIETATFVKVNPSFLRLHGYSENEVLGRTFLDFIHPDDVAPTILVIEEELKLGNKVLRFENRYRTKEGEYRFLDWSFNPNLDSGLAYSIAHDITERRNEEAQAWKQHNELAHMSRISTMGEMATGIAHELNQPLMAIAAYSFAANRLVEQAKISPLEIQEILSKLEDQAIRAGDIVRRLRNFVKKTESLRKSIDLNMLIQDVAIFVEPDRRQSETKLTFRFIKPAPRVLVDEIQIQQVLVNLIRNAIDAMQELPTSLREVTVSTHILQDKHAEVTVSDSGIGLSHEEFEQVFNAFFSTKPEGMGMGLPISRSIVEAHGGKLFAERNHVSGMAFKFTLPLEDCNG
ncbi:PAS domain S-box protein [uncultured Gimesia sp.]|uniref:PAS domain S-box protein n=1 Tax=uncultured Gimesia sp. TaxID=1678688 RepID=UPI0026127BE3|nr:PAS domain S-box protein [uncultured Gimesia sp.]